MSSSLPPLLEQSKTIERPTCRPLSPLMLGSRYDHMPLCTYIHPWLPPKVLQPPIFHKYSPSISYFWNDSIDLWDEVLISNLTSSCFFISCFLFIVIYIVLISLESRKFIFFRLSCLYAWFEEIWVALMLYKFLLCWSVLAFGLWNARNLQVLS